MNETWKSIPNYSDYLVSDMGNIRSLKFGRDRLLEPAKNNTGYCVFAPCRDGKQTWFLVHHLVLLAFVGPRPEGMVTRHLNGNPSDNRLKNLMYGTQKENCGDMVQHGKHNMARKTQCKYGHPYDLENTRVYKKMGDVVQRVCRACDNLRVRILRTDLDGKVEI